MVAFVHITEPLWGESMWNFDVFFDLRLNSWANNEDTSDRNYTSWYIKQTYIYNECESSFTDLL